MRNSYISIVIEINNLLRESKMNAGYRVAKYKISYVKEKDSGHRAIEEKRIVSSKYDVKAFIKNYLSDLPYEKVCVVALNSKNAIIGFISFEGTVNQTAVYPREVFSFLMSCGATCFVMSHNHPAETAEASEADWAVTKKLQAAGSALDINMLDHIILAGENTVSLRECNRWNR